MKQSDLRFSEQIEAKLLLDSINPNGQRVLTYLLSVPNIVHAEILRHRSASFSVTSNRAIPTNKLNGIDAFVPTSVGYNESGMQATVSLNNEDLNHFQNVWLAGYNAMKYIIAQATPLSSNKKVHKQHLNRLTMAFQIPTMVVTICEPGLRNLFVQRVSDKAQPEIHELAIKMEELYSASKPNVLKWGEWHTPFILENELTLPLFERLMVSCARCARTSYRLNTTNEFSNFESDLGLAKKLINDYHLSPFEHVVMAFDPTWLDNVNKRLANKGLYDQIYKKFNNIYRNVPGFMQLRPLVEHVNKINPTQSTTLIHAFLNNRMYDEYDYDW